MSVLPKGWCRAPLEQIAGIKLGKMLDKAKNKGELYPYLRNVNVRWGGIDLSDLLEMPFLPDELDTYCIQDGDLFICEGGEPGRSAVWRRGSTSVKFQKAIHRVRFEEGMTPEFFAAELRYAAAVGSLDELFVGTTIKHLTRQVLAARAFPVPPSEEQRRIVAKLDALDASAKRARADLDRISTLVARAKQAILKRAFSGELISQESKQHIRQLALDAIVESTFYGPRISNDAYTEVGIPTLRTTDIGAWGRLEPHSPPLVSVTQEEYERWGFIDQDLMITRTGATIGKCAVYEKEFGPALPSAYLIRVRLNLAIADARFVILYLHSVDGLEQLLAGRTATAQPNINARAIGRVRLPLPSLAEQREIVRRIEAAFAKIDRIAADAASARALLDRLDQAILAKAFRGELVPQDPNDEPAEKLLEKIKAARAAPPARRTRKKQL